MNGIYMWDGSWHNYTLKMVIKGKLEAQQYVAMSDDDAIDRFYIRMFTLEDAIGCNVDAYELINDNTEDIIHKRISIDILDYI